MNKSTQAIVSACLIVIAAVHVANFAANMIIHHRAVEAAYMTGYIDGDADGFTEGIHAIDPEDYLRACQNGSLTADRRQDYFEDNQENLFVSVDNGN